MALEFIDDWANYLLGESDGRKFDRNCPIFEKITGS